MRVLVLLNVVCFVYTQNDYNKNNLPTNISNKFKERIGNFSLELLYHTSIHEKANNLVMSPITVWALMSSIAEGASGNTLLEIKYALRLTKNRTETRVDLQTIAPWLQVQTNTVELAKLNAIFVSSETLFLKDFENIVKTYYDTQTVIINFSENKTSLANKINQGITKFTQGKIQDLVKKSYLSDAGILLTSALYFKGQWTVPFNSSLTTVKPFFDSNGKNIGQVNMMYNRHNYPYANIEYLQARVIELPYGLEDRMSMLVMLPYPYVSLDNMYKNFLNVPLHNIFSKLRIKHNIYNDHEVDCYLPRFKIETNLDLTEIMKKQFGINDLFNKSESRLSEMARTPLYVHKIIHKVDIQVNEDGVMNSKANDAEFVYRVGASKFEANRPFSYVIVEKITNTIVMGGFYVNPSVY